MDIRNQRKRPPNPRRHLEHHRPPTMRAFIAFEISPGARKVFAEVIELLSQQPNGNKIRWMHPENLHVTLRFLGDITTLQVARITQHVTEAIKGIAPFPVQLGAVKPFPPDRPHVLSVAMTATTSMMRLAQAVERGVVAAGLQAEVRPFLPHLTIGRSRTPTFPHFENIPVKNIGAFTTEEIVLFRSDLKKSGAIHTPVVRIPL